MLGKTWTEISLDNENEHANVRKMTKPRWLEESIRVYDVCALTRRNNGQEAAREGAILQNGRLQGAVTSVRQSA